MAPRKPPQQRLVLALDCDCFYAQCETRRDPSLAGKPVGVRQKHLVITSNYAARAFGIRKGDSLAEVRRKCPQIVIKDGEDISHYTEVSNAWRAFVANFVGSRCPVEKSGLDELFDSADDRALTSADIGRELLVGNGHHWPVVTLPVIRPGQSEQNIQHMIGRGCEAERLGGSLQSDCDFGFAEIGNVVGHCKTLRCKHPRRHLPEGRDVRNSRHNNPRSPASVKARRCSFRRFNLRKSAEIQRSRKMTLARDSELA